MQNNQMKTKTVAVILGAGLPYRGYAPTSLQVTDNKRVVLDWALAALNDKVDEKIFVGGYHVDWISSRYRNIRYVINASWRETGSVGSLLSVSLDERTRYLVIYGDIVFEPGIVDQLLALDPDCMGICTDRNYHTDRLNSSGIGFQPKEVVEVDGTQILSAGYKEGEQRGDAEFIGLMVLPGHVVEKLKTPAYRDDKGLLSMNLTGLLQRLIDDGHIATAVEVGKNRWTEINKPRDLAEFVFGTKAETLERLKTLVSKCKIGNQVSFSVGDWRNDQEYCLKRVVAEFDKNLVVRSSTQKEDGWERTNAGAYLSILDVPLDDERCIEVAPVVCTAKPDL